MDYILHLTDIADTLDTIDLKEILNQEMQENDAFVLGNYTLDPKGTDFIGKFGRVSFKPCLIPESGLVKQKRVTVSTFELVLSYEGNVKVKALSLL